MRTKLDIEPVALDDLGTSDEFMQSRLWARAKAHRGMEPYAFSVKSGEMNINLLILDPQPGQKSRLLSVPRGPLFPDPPADYAQAMWRIAEGVAPFLPEGAVGIRFDLPWPSLYWEDEVDGFRGRPADRLEELRMNFGRGERIVRKAATDVLPVDTAIIDLSCDEAQILASMKAKTRYNIRLASRCGVRVARCSPGDPGLPAALEHWHALSAETEERNALAPTGREHVDALFEAALGGGSGVGSGGAGDDALGVGSGGAGGDALGVELLLAYGGDAAGADMPLAGAIIARSGASATYLYGASANREREKMAPYAIQWAAIQSARRAGCRRYDLFGVPPGDNPAHPLHGLRRFKAGFGGREFHYAGCWDVPLDEDAYEVLRARESAGPSFHQHSSA